MSGYRFDTIAVLGAGTMGAGIAQVAAAAGCAVRLRDVRADLVERGLVVIRTDLEKGVSLGKVPAAERDRILAAIGGAVEVAEAVAGADCVIEAVPEDRALKRQVWAEVDRHAGVGALFATNTSGLSVTELAGAVRGPERFLGMHFFNPVPRMKLLELVRGERTSDEAVGAAREFAKRIGKEPIVVRDAPGFASTRLGIAVGLEAMRMVEAGVAAPEDIDKAMELGYGFPMGPLRLTDLVGLDVRLAIAEHLHAELGEVFRPPQILKRLVRAGKLGRKSGEGFYRY